MTSHRPSLASPEVSQPCGTGLPSQCAIPECDRTIHSRGWCHTHYQRWLRQGDPLKIGKGGRRPWYEHIW